MPARLPDRSVPVKANVLPFSMGFAMSASRGGDWIGVLFGDLADDPARVAGGEYPLRDVPGNHAPRADHRSRPDFRPRADHGPAPDPHVRADLDRLAELLLPPQLGVHGVGRRVDLDRGAEEGEVADGDPAHVEHDAVEV